MRNLVGTQIKNYRIDALLGEGGMGAVYRAFDMNLKRDVALKVMHEHYARQPQFQERFQQEAQSVARLKHPSIVTVYSFGQAPELYIEMELIPGITLGQHFTQLAERREIVQLKESLHLIIQVAQALGYAHRQGVIHRDIKPGNILVTPLDHPARPDEPPLRAVVTDFGLAKLQVGGVVTQTGAVMGTLPYMSPEQLEAKELDGRSDLYSLGIVLYQLATGQLPYEIRSLADAVLKHRNEPPPDPRLIQPGLPQNVAAVILKAMAKTPDDRYQTGGALANALQEVSKTLTKDDVTRFMTVGEAMVVSLSTQLKDYQEPVSVPSRMDVNETLVGIEDRLIVAQKGSAPYAVTLTKSRMTLGRDASNDIVLVGNGMSRRHARLERSSVGWHIVDLNSTNGTFVGDRKLLPDVPQIWQHDQDVRIGPFFLRWQRPEDGWAVAEAAAPAIQPVQEAQKRRLLPLILLVVVLMMCGVGAISAWIYYQSQNPVVTDADVNATAVAVDVVADADPADGQIATPQAETNSDSDNNAGDNGAVSAELPTEAPVVATAVATDLPPTETIEPTPVPTNTPTPTIDPRPVRDVLSWPTAGGQDIEVVRFGGGPHDILFVGGIHSGAAPATTALAYRLIEYLEENPSEVPPSVTIHIVPELNRDSQYAPGELAGRVNANAVDMNRNWDCNWRQNAAWRGSTIANSGGSSPFSEPEAKGLQVYITNTQPEVVVVWFALFKDGLISPGYCSDVGGGPAIDESWAFASRYGRSVGYKIADYEDVANQTINGDITNWLDKIGIPNFGVILPDYEQVDWAKNRDGARAIIQAYE